MGELWTSAAVATLAFVLASAGAAKLARSPVTSGSPAPGPAGPATPAPATAPPLPHRRLRRLQGGAELALAVAALLAPVRIVAILLALTFAAFAAVHARHRRGDEPPEDCGCFGEPTGLGAHAGGRRLALTALSALLAGAVAVAAAGARAPVLALVHRPGSGVVALLVAALAAQAWRTAFTASAGGRGRFRATDPRPASAPRRASDRLVTGSALFLERRFSRRGLLVRLAAAGSALTVAPLRYLLYPGTALAAIRPGDCSHGACTDGYTAFCCEINHGQNSCPTGTFAGGWWMCTDYPGHKLCAAEGIRYYVDCNALPGHPYPGGCRCAGSTCDERRVACNVFRYGQCNTHIAGITAVVCRMVVCENPSTVSELNCSSSMAVDDAVCRHEAGCLEPALQIGAPGGA